VSDRDPGVELSLQPADVPTPPVAPAPPLPHRKAVRSVATPAPIATDPMPVTEEVAPPEAESFAVAPTTPAYAPSAYAHPDDDARYAAELRSDIDRRTRPPDSAQYRLRHPSGEVRVRFVLVRSGQTQRVALEHSSGSVLLDEAALSIVRSGHYPPMPAKTFVGESEHTFVVTIEFRPLNLPLQSAVSKDLTR
jgi:TonB family protein